LSTTDTTRIRELLYRYFQIVKTKEIDKMEELLDPRFTKFGDRPPYDRREEDRALMLDHLQVVSISDYEFEIEDMRIDIIGDSFAANATFILKSKGILVDDYTFSGNAIKFKSRVTAVLQKNDSGEWKIIHQHISEFPS
jgi:ketosteroid isomerase-like protein